MKDVTSIMLELASKKARISLAVEHICSCDSSLNLVTSCEIIAAGCVLSNGL